jgi:cytochrome P450
MSEHADLTDLDFFRDPALVGDPYPYFDQLRGRCPVQREPHHDVVMVTGYEEALAVYHDTDVFSSCTSVTGPFPGFPVPLEGDDVTDVIESHRDDLPFSDQITTMDPPKHTAHRGLLMRLLTPKRLAENEAFIWALADQQIDEFLPTGRCEVVRQLGGPFTMLVIADLLGVPESDHAWFIEAMGRRGGHVGGTGGGSMQKTPLEVLYDKFVEYLEARREAPTGDVLTGLATATFSDGTLPEAGDVAKIASNLFAAGQETTIRLLGTAFLRLAEDVSLQERLRADHALIPNFIEECLRHESPVKGDFRLSRVATTVGGVDVPAGTTVMVLNGAANRDERKFADAGEFDIERENAREHLAFGHGAHFCPGATLARTEGRIAVQRMLERTSEFRVDEAEHGPADDRRYQYAPTFILRGLEALHLELTPA